MNCIKVKLTLLPAPLLCRFISALASLMTFSLASTNIRLNLTPNRMLSLHPPQTNSLFLSRPLPTFLGSQAQFSSSPLLHDRVIECTTALEVIAYKMAVSRFPAKNRHKNDASQSLKHHVLWYLFVVFVDTKDFVSDKSITYYLPLRKRIDNSY